MSNSKKLTNKEELRRIEDAWIQSVLDASGDELRTEIREAGDDPDEYIALANAMLAKAREQCGHERLARAKVEAAAFRARENQTVVPFDRTKVKAELEAAKIEPSSEMMLAARKGKELSVRDDEALLRARGKLKRLESEDETE